MDQDAMKRRLGRLGAGHGAAPRPALVGLGIEVRSLSATRSWLEDQGRECREGQV